MDKEKAYSLLAEYNKEPFHIKHALIVSNVMRYIALQYNEDSEKWALAGLLHDIDYEKYPNEHCVKAEEILEKNGAEEWLIKAVCSHGYGLTGTKYRPETQMEKFLYCVDELTGLIGAAALMRPSKSVADMELKSIKKKFKDKKFAAGCDREVIKNGATCLQLDLDSVFDITLKAMQSCEDEVNNALQLFINK